jgi:hypothetical protein
MDQKDETYSKVKLMVVDHPGDTALQSCTGSLVHKSLFFSKIEIAQGEIWTAIFRQVYHYGWAGKRLRWSELRIRQ